MDVTPGLNTHNSAAQHSQLNAAQTYPVAFTGTGGEYFRIWIVNLLLIFVTLGIYTPWAKVRKIKYFYSNTLIDDQALDFHGEPKKMLRGTAIVGAFFVLYSFAAEFSALAALVAALAFLIVWPPLYRAGLKFRLANTSWRGLRMRLVPASLKEAYISVGVPNLLIIAPFVGLTLANDAQTSAGRAGPGPWASVWAPYLGIGVALFLISLPYFVWRARRYSIGHAAWGALRMEFRSTPGAMYKLFLQGLMVVFLITALFAGLALMLTPGIFSASGAGKMAWLLALLPLFLLFLLVLNTVPKAYLAAQLQNLVWSRTGNNSMRFKSELAPWRYVGLQIKNYLLIAITLGLYWPFAAVANHRMQLQAVVLKSRISLSHVSDWAQKREHDAAGDAAADLFDMDFGM